MYTLLLAAHVVVAQAAAVPASDSTTAGRPRVTAPGRPVAEPAAEYVQVRVTTDVVHHDVLARLGVRAVATSSVGAAPPRLALVPLRGPATVLPRGLDPRLAVAGQPLPVALGLLRGLRAGDDAVVTSEDLRTTVRLGERAGAQSGEAYNLATGADGLPAWRAFVGTSVELTLTRAAADTGAGRALRANVRYSRSYLGAGEQFLSSEYAAEVTVAPGATVVLGGVAVTTRRVSPGVAGLRRVPGLRSLRGVAPSVTYAPGDAYVTLTATPAGR